MRIKKITDPNNSDLSQKEITGSFSSNYQLNILKT